MLQLQYRIRGYILFSDPSRHLLAYLEPDWGFESQQEEKVILHLMISNELISFDPNS